MNPEKNVPICLAITPNATVRVGTTMGSRWAQRKEEKEGGIIGKRDGFT